LALSNERDDHFVDSVVVILGTLAVVRDKCDNLCMLPWYQFLNIREQNTTTYSSKLSSHSLLAISWIQLNMWSSAS